jgi:hypothetical protein
MLATFAIELLFAALVFIRYRVTRFGKVSVLVLALLAVFQFAEFRICTTPGEISKLWPRIGFAAVTLLPLAGLYLVSLVSRKPHFLKLGYATAIGFGAYFVFVPKSISSAICGGNYIIFNASNDFHLLYGIYYLGFLLLGIWESIEHIESLTRASRAKSVLQWMIIAYISFMGPMAATYLLFPVTRNAVASIMCGFAVAMAVILTFKIVPAYDRMHRHRPEHRQNKARGTVREFS